MPSPLIGSKLTRRLSAVVVAAFLAQPISAQSHPVCPYQVSGVMVMAAIDTPTVSTMDYDGVLDRLYMDLFCELGLQLVRIAMPPARSLAEMRAGNIDGDYLRAEIEISPEDNVLVVPEPIAMAHLVALSLQDISNVADLDALVSQRVGVVRGWTILEDQLDQFESVSEAVGVEELLRLLMSGRIDVALILQGTAELYPDTIGNTSVYQSQVMLSRPAYMYLHKRHADIIKPLAKAIRESKANGSFAAYMSGSQEKAH